MQKQDVRPGLSESTLQASFCRSRALQREAMAAQHSQTEVAKTGNVAPELTQSTCTFGLDEDSNDSLPSSRILSSERNSETIWSDSLN